MRIGLFIGTHSVPWDVLGQADQVVAAEKDGFDSIWFAQVGGADVLTVLALAGPKTSRIELGTAIVPTYTRHPNVMAQQALTVNAAAGGRLTLGIGPSHRPAIERLGLSYDHAARHVREYLSVLRPLVDTGRVSFKGKVFNITTGIQAPGPPFPILISALAPLMLRVAGELADGTITWMVGRRALEARVRPGITAAAAAAGRPPPRIVVGLPVAVCDDDAAGRERAGRVFHGYGSLVNYRRMLDAEGAEGPADIAIVGSEAQVERDLRRFAEAGATDVILSVFPVGEDAAASIARTRALLKSLVGRV